MTWNLLEKKEEKRTEDIWLTPDKLQKKTGLKVLVWGEPETGKTHFALTFPPPVYVIDTESPLTYSAQRLSIRSGMEDTMALGSAPFRQSSGNLEGSNSVDDRETKTSRTSSRVLREKTKAPASPANRRGAEFGGSDTSVKHTRTGVKDREFGTAPLLPKFKGKEVYIFPACQLDADVKVDPAQSIEAVEEAISKLGRLDKGTIVLDSATDLWQKEAATASFAEALLSPP
jgi:hypothetical protein